MTVEQEYIVITGIKDEETVKKLTTAETVREYLEKSETSIVMTNKEIELVLGYFEGHGYMVGAMEGQLLRGDLCHDDETIPWELYSVDDMIDAACEWNYEMILEEEAKQKMADDSYVDPYPTRYKELKEDERVLDRLFDMTKYNGVIEQLAEQLADQFIAGLGLAGNKESEVSSKSVEQAVSGLMEQVRGVGGAGRSR